MSNADYDAIIQRMYGGADDEEPDIDLSEIERGDEEHPFFDDNSSPYNEKLTKKDKLMSHVTKWGAKTWLMFALTSVCALISLILVALNVRDTQSKGLVWTMYAIQVVLFLLSTGLTAARKAKIGFAIQIIQCVFGIIVQYHSTTTNKMLQASSWIMLMITPIVSGLTLLTIK